MAFVHSVPISAKKFTQKDLEVSKKYVNPEVYPGLYDNAKLRKGLRYIDRRIMNIEDINVDVAAIFTGLDLKDYANNHFVTQAAAIRLNGRGENSDAVIADINTNGYELSHWPISVTLCPNDEDMILDGRTRLEALKLAGFTNVIVDYYTCETWDVYFIEAIKRNPPQKPRSPMKKEDIIASCNVAIERGWMKKDPDEISERVREITGNTISYNTLQKIIHNVMYGSSYTSAVLSLDEDKAAAWLKRNGYIDNDKGNGIYYKVVSASAWTKAVAATADRLVDELEGNGKKVKELRVILHTGTLDGADPVKSWQGKIDSFRTGWKENINNIEKAFFSESTRRATIKLYGVIPAVSALSNLYPMDKLVMFHVGKLKDKSFAQINLEEELEDTLLA
jgi:hypothetical protein